MPGIIGALVSGKMAKLIDLQTVYGAKDAYDLLEIMLVDRHNDEVMREHGNRD